jgi:hypothetical protein
MDKAGNTPVDHRRSIDRTIERVAERQTDREIRDQAFRQESISKHNTILMNTERTIEQYREFLRAKWPSVPKTGFTISGNELTPSIYPHAKASVIWAAYGKNRLSKVTKTRIAQKTKNNE